MMDPLSAHLTNDDLDALLDRSADPAVVRHADACAECRALAGLDARVVRGLEGLPRFAPSAAFADRVMAGVAVRQAPAAAGLRLLDRLAPRRAALVAVGLVAPVSLSVVWGALNRDLLTAMGSGTLDLLGGWLWNLLRATGAALAAQPWYGPLREVSASPVRLGVALTAVAMTYGAILLALRRLMALPAGPRPYANG